MQKISPHYTIFRYGAISGLIATVIFILTILLGLIDMTNPLKAAFTGLLSIIVPIVITVFAVKHHREELNNQITFGQAFAVAFGVGLIGTIIGLITQYLYITFIEPDLYLQMANDLEEFFEKRNLASDPRTKATIEEVKNSGNISTMIKQLTRGSFFLATIACIVAAIMKRENQNPFS